MALILFMAQVFSLHGFQALNCPWAIRDSLRKNIWNIFEGLAQLNSSMKLETKVNNNILTFAGRHPLFC